MAYTRSRSQGSQLAAITDDEHEYHGATELAREGAGLVCDHVETACALRLYVDHRSWPSRGRRVHKLE